MGCKRFLSVTLSLKAGVSVLFVAFLLHVVGFSLPQWSIFENDVDTLRIGLWKDCLCNNRMGFFQCFCLSKTASAGSFQVVLAFETTGLVGLIFSGCFSIILLLSSEDKRLKAINISIVLGAAVLIVTDCILYAVDTSGDDRLTTIGRIFRSMVFDRSRLGAFFFLCTVAGALSLIFCPSLLVIDYRTARGVYRSNQFNSMFSNEGQITTTPSFHVAVQYSVQEPVSQNAPEAQLSPPTAHPA